MSTPDIGEIMKQAQAMQQKVTELQEELGNKRFTAASGGGMVEVTVTGHLRVVEVKIEPGLIADGDREMIQDLTAAAVNAAMEQAQRGVQAEMQKMTGGLGLPDIPGLGGLG